MEAYRTGSPEGVAGSGEGFPDLEGPSGARRSGETYLAFPYPIGPGSLQGSWARPSALRGPLGHVGPRGVGGR